MTIQSSTSRVTYSGDNVSTVFPVPFLFFANVDITAVKTAVGGGVTTLTLNVDYTLTGATLPAGGTLTKTTALLTGETLGVFLDPPRTQLAHYLTNDIFPAATLETNLDREVQISQRLYDLITRAIRAPDSDNNPQLTLPSAVSRALKYPTFDGSGNLSMAVSVPSGTLSQASIGSFLNPQTAAEASAAITPTNLTFDTRVALTPQRFGAVGDGVANDTTALQNWLTVLGNAAQVAYGYLPRGTYSYTANLTVPANVYILGAGNQTTILKPTVAVTTALTTSSGVKLHGFMIEGSSTSKATGLVIGPVGPDYNEVQDVWVQNFVGASNGTSGAGVGIVVQNVVSLFALRMFAIGCNIGIVVQSPTPQSLPTTCVFQSCRFRTSVIVPTSLAQTGSGVRVLSGQLVTFRDCIMEVNGAHGVFVQASTAGGAGIVQDLVIENCWFEDNWHARVDTGSNVYSIHVDGTTGAGINITLKNLHLSQGSLLSDRKALLLASCQFSLDRVRAFYGFANDIVVTGGAAALGVVVDDSYDRCGRFMNIAAAQKQVSYPVYLPIIDLGTGASVLPSIEKLAGLAYSTSITPDLKDGNELSIQVSNTVAFTINAPLSVASVQFGKRLTIRINNISGNNVLGALTWNAIYKLAAWVQPQNNFYHSIEFSWNGTNWGEVSRTTTQVPV